eukprot:TRINITY_DN32369_c0_g1_i1.p5 TRINITY_DN32369_c0_g1~~TRINITY_DN32369_c0_g1_i1.p5  ORF type:complete len:155 (+),score=50.08 TRINITY_DN32369_c0_g1_i1:857-1321(+)
MQSGASASTAPSAVDEWFSNQDAAGSESPRRTPARNDDLQTLHLQQTPLRARSPNVAGGGVGKRVALPAPACPPGLMRVPPAPPAEQGPALPEALLPLRGEAADERVEIRLSNGSAAVVDKRALMKLIDEGGGAAAPRAVSQALFPPTSLMSIV